MRVGTGLFLTQKATPNASAHENGTKACSFRLLCLSTGSECEGAEIKGGTMEKEIAVDCKNAEKLPVMVMLLSRGEITLTRRSTLKEALSLQTFVRNFCSACNDVIYTPIGWEVVA